MAEGGARGRRKRRTRSFGGEGREEGLTEGVFAEEDKMTMEPWVVCKFGGILMAKGELTFPTYHQLLTEMYPTALKRSQTQTKQARSFAPSSYAARTRTTTAHAHEDDELRRLRQRLAMQEESTRRQLQMQEASSRQRAHEAGGIQSAYHSLNNGLTMQQALWFTY